MKPSPFLPIPSSLLPLLLAAPVQAAQFFPTPHTPHPTPPSS
ncbi:hypothetical protein [Kovacikia minuta]|nr:hypothetical protein [Kovacikia minuta]